MTPTITQQLFEPGLAARVQARVWHRSLDHARLRRNRGE